MKVEIDFINENEDGSANAQVSFDKEGLQVLIQWGLIGLLTKGLDEYAVRTKENNFPVKKRNTRKKAK